MLARLFVFFGGLLVIALCSLLLAPFFVDWAGYKSAFEREASRIVGQPVRVESVAKARILPFPSVTFSNVSIGGVEGMPSAKIAAFSMDAELAPFLSGEILIFDMRIDRPDVRLTSAENGALRWAFPKGDVLNGNSVSLENVNIIEGRVTIERDGRQPLLLDGVNGKISAQALSGPWLAEGQFKHAATTYDAKLSTGAKVAEETLRLKLSINPVDGFYDAEFDGQAGMEAGALVYRGQLDISVLGKPKIAGEPRQKIADVKGEFSADATGIRLNEATLTAGPKETPYRADGNASIIFGDNARFDVSLKGQQFSFGEIEGSAKADRVALGVPLADRWAALEAALLQIPLPEIPGRVELALPALIIGDTIIRNAEIKAVPSSSGWQIEKYSIELPGRTIVEGAGEFQLETGLAFSGQMTLASKQPTGFANWLGFAANDAIRALPGSGFTARIDVNAARQTMRDLEFRAGAAVLRGLVDRQVSQGAKPKLSIQLKGENADLDVLSSIAGLASAQSAKEQDIDLALSSAPVTGFGLQAESLDFEAQIIGDKFLIDQIEVTGFAGADFNMAGELSNTVTTPNGTLDFTLNAFDPLPIIETLAVRFPSQSWLKSLAQRAGFAGTAVADAKLRSTIEINGDGAQAASPNMRANYQFDAAGVSFEGSAEGVLNQIVKIAAKGNADNGETLLAAMGVAVGDSMIAIQPLEPVSFDVSVLADGNSIQSGSLKAASNLDVFETELGQNANPFFLNLADAAPYATAAGYTLPGSAFGLPLKLKGNWQNTGNALKLLSVDGSLLDVAINGSLDAINGERLKFIGNLKAASLDRSFLDEIVFGPLSANGDETADFSNGLTLPFDFDATINITKPTGFIAMPLSNASARVVVTKDALKVTDLEATIASGKLSGAAEIIKNSADALLSFNGSVAGADLSVLNAPALSGKADLQVELSATGSSLEILKASAAGSGVISASGAELNGIDAAGFGDLVVEADSRENAPDTIATLEMIDRKIMLGATKLPAFQSAFTISSGVARAPKNLLNIVGGTLAVEPSIDLKNGVAGIETQLLFDAGDEAAAGTEPALNLNLQGQWNALSMVVDPQPLQGFLGQRALEREEIRVAAIQSALLEKQRLRRENRYYAGLIEARAKAEAERLAEIARLAAIQAEQERLAKEQLEKERLKKERLEAERLKAAEVVQSNDPANMAPAEDLPLNLDGLIEQLEKAPTVQP